jgi:GxxExxY protein
MTAHVYDTQRHRGTEDKTIQDNSLTYRIIGCGIEVHRQLGPGLSESNYEEALCIEMTEAGLSYVRQVGAPVMYKGQQIGEHRPDLVVENGVVVEIKSVERLIGVHRAQVLTYMRLPRVPLGLVLNFNEEVLRTGIERLRI